MSKKSIEAQKENTDLSHAANMRYLTADQATFRETDGHMLSVYIGEEIYPAIYLHCSFPHMDNTIYISVRTGDNKEVGMIKSLVEFPDDTIKLLNRHINLRYFAPKITNINAIREEFGYSYWDTETDSGKCCFTVRTGGGNVTTVTDQKMLITDVDGNRFVIEDLSHLSEKEYKMIEMLMV